MKTELKSFEIREGNGNVGAYKRGFVEAENARKALITAHRIGMICSPWDVRITKDIEGDDVQARVESFVGCNDLGVRWLAEANDVEEINRRIHESLANRFGIEQPYKTDAELAS